MIISRTPFRLSFFGGGTDYPVWYQEGKGAVLATTINKYCYISCRYLPPFFEYRTRIAYSKIEMVKTNEEIKHPAVRAVLKYLKIDHGVEIHHDGDLPAGTGLGASSAFTVSLLHALHALQQTMPTKMELTKEAIEIEQEILRENLGCQDQVMAAYGGLCRVDFFPGHEIQVTPIILSRKRFQDFQDHLLLYFTGLATNPSGIAAREQTELTKSRRSELQAIYQIVQEGISILTARNDLTDFGLLLHEAWKLKQRLSVQPLSPQIDEIYRTAREAGAIGGKLLGAGDGGFLLLFGKPHQHTQIKEALAGWLRVPFSFETMGSQIIFYQPDTLIDRDYPADFQLREEGGVWSESPADSVNMPTRKD